jgi:lysophospholipase L1-like esterase
MNAVGKVAFGVSLFLLPIFTLAQRSASRSGATAPDVPESRSWVAAWAASPESADADASEPLLNIDNQTVRERVRLSVGGRQIRLQLSNEFGSSSLVVDSVTVALPNGPAGVQVASVRTVTFDGRSSATLPAGAPLLSDPVDFPVAPGAEISISLYFPKRVGSVTWHYLALKHAIISTRGDHTRDEKIEGGADSESSIALSAVLVPAQPSQRLIVAFGDSVVDGDGSTVDADQNWPDHLIRRLQKAGLGSKVAVVNEGIAGNRLLDDGPFAHLGVSALARFDRDALSLPGVTHVMLREGINDLGFPGAKLRDKYLADPADVRTAEDVIEAYRQLIARAHARGVKVIGCTLSPFEGAELPGYYSETKEADRQKVNQWIRSSNAFDGVIDFDQVLRDPNHPRRVLPRFVSEDHLHPNDAGYQAMADAINISLIR